jgi:hypothetical protein
MGVLLIDCTLYALLLFLLYAVYTTTILTIHCIHYYYSYCTLYALGPCPLRIAMAVVAMEAVEAVVVAVRVTVTVACLASQDAALRRGAVRGVRVARRRSRCAESVALMNRTDRTGRTR